MKPLRLVIAVLLATGCRDTPPPGTGAAPLPLERVIPASDLRVDGDGRLLGSLTGEGTSRRIHALSNDTAVVLALLAQTRPSPDPIGRLRSGAELVLDPAHDAVTTGDVVVATPRGYTRGRLREVRLRADACGSRPIAEFVIESAAAPPDGGPPLLGPVLVSLRPGDAKGFEPSGFIVRRAIPLPDSSVSALRRAAEQMLDSSLAARLAPQWLPLTPPQPSAVQINVLSDIDGADVVAFGTATAVGYAVSVRERRVAATGDTLLATGAYAWSAGRPRALVAATAFRLSRGAVAPIDPSLPPGYARRLTALAGFGSSVDHLWFEYIDVAAGSATWTVVAPESHTVAAAVTVAGRCPR